MTHKGHGFSCLRNKIVNPISMFFSYVLHITLYSIYDGVRYIFKICLFTCMFLNKNILEVAYLKDEDLLRR